MKIREILFAPIVFIGYILLIIGIGLCFGFKTAVAFSDKIKEDFK